LIAHPEEAQAYGRLKEDLARRFPEDIDSYVEGKSEFIREIDAKAKAWAEGARTATSYPRTGTRRQLA